MGDPKENKSESREGTLKTSATVKSVELEDDSWEDEGLPTSLNEELTEKIKDDPNKFIGCGG